MNNCFYCHKPMKNKERKVIPDGRIGHARCVLKYMMWSKGGKIKGKDNVTLKID